MTPQPTCAPKNGPSVRGAAPADCAYLADLHAATLPHGFFVELGARFLRAYHRTFVDGPHARAYIATLGDDRVGGIVGTLDNRTHWRWAVRHRGPVLALAGLLCLCARPAVAVRFVRTRARRYLGAVVRLVGGRWRPRPGTSAPPPHRVAVLTHVCVEPTVQGRGVGGALVDAFLEDARAAGAREVTLVTLAGDDGAGPFYARRGWTYAGAHNDQDGRPLSIYTRTLP